LTAFVVCPLGVFNLWPFSSWELFSHLRTDRQSGWQAVAVGAGGRVRVDSNVTRGYRGDDFKIASFASEPVAQRNETCEAWLHAARPGTRTVEIYHLVWRLSDRHGKRAAPPRRTLAWVCTARGAHAS
jgi:hypothetical protein